ncbi:MAG TPA: GNAT family N-acetyltransferase [Dehalococcoidia bacterium]|jgi:GNAT superfamily N-acetyltransferase|nr:GNAT family N-acetyltransferase [Dehalococcoidia bacterium]
MVTQTPIVSLESARITGAGKVLGRAFWDDPAAIYVMPDDAKRTEELAWFMTNAARYGDLFGSVDTTADKVEGAAIWLPPAETHVSDEKMSEAGFDELADRLGEDGYERFGNMFGRMDELHERDMSDPHWYLFILGVDPPRQGQGMGSAIIRRGLDRADAEDLPCYLETMKARNVPFYQKHGFEVVVDEIISNGGPRLWTMRRQPR